MSREDAIARLAEVFREYGYEGTTLSRLSEATGLGKASLYHYFPDGKEGMVRAVLKMLWEQLETKVLAPLRSHEPPKVRLEGMAEGLKAFYQGGHQSCLLAVLSLGGASERFQPEVEKALRTWIETIAEVLQQAGIDAVTARQRAEDAVGQIQGSLLLSRALNDTSPFERIMKCLPLTLLREPDR
jgi:AcrR family transcriptional regulator